MANKSVAPIDFATHMAGSVQDGEAEGEGRRSGRLQPAEDGHEEPKDALNHTLKNQPMERPRL